MANLVSEVASLHAGQWVSAQHVNQTVADALSSLGELASLDVNGVLGWFKQSGYGMAPDSRIGLQHSNLAWVIEQRRGIPISLAMVLIEGARRCGRQAHGINYPGHFLVRIDEVYVDPLRMTVVDAGQFSSLQKEPGAGQVASPIAIGLRMLNNLKAIHVAAFDWPRALEITDLQLSIAQAAPAAEEMSASLHFEQGEYWRQLGALSAAKDAYLRVVGDAAPQPIKDKARARAEAIDTRKEIWH